MAADSIISAMCDSLILVDHDGHIVTANRATLDLSGYREEELLGKSVDLIFGREFVESQILEKVMEEGSVVNQEWKYYTKKGETKPILFSGCPVNDKRGDIIGVIGISRGTTERKWAEEAVRESETRFKELADLLPQTVFELDEEGKLTFVNRNALPMFGFSQEDFEKGVNALQTIVPEDRDRAKENIQRALSGEKVGPSEYTLLRNDGSTFPAIVYSSPVLKESKPVGLRGIVIDITERRQTEKALRESEARYRAVMEQSPDGIFLVDVETRQVLEANSAFQNMLEYTYSETLDLSLPDFAVADPKDLDRRFTDALMGKGPFAFERKYRRKDGSWVDVGGSSSPIYFGGRKAICVIVRDPTEHKRVEEALRESEARYRTVVEQSADGIYLTDVDTKRILEANTAFQDLLGYRAVQLSVHDFIAADRMDVDQNFQKIIRGEPPSLLSENSGGRMGPCGTAPRVPRSSLMGEGWFLAPSSTTLPSVSEWRRRSINATTN